MNDDVALRVENVSKKYCKSLKRSMLYGIQDVGRNLLGRSSQPEQLRKSEFWALDNISFDVKKGETLGIIGPNGAGKTTLLKMLNGIFWPDKGKIIITGRIGALIAVGAGFHPMLTGRENIYVNAAIIGMSKKDVDAKFDEIVEFAGIGDFLDSPVKHYSSGMFVRLGFSVAAYCNPEILLIDEVLSVGDLEFALKCHKKMSEFRQNGGTVIIVSHNMQAIRNICRRVLWLAKGSTHAIGDVYEICELYEEETMFRQKDLSSMKGTIVNNDPSARITNVEFLDEHNVRCTTYNVGNYLKIRIHFSCKRTVYSPIFTVSFYNQEGLVISSNYSTLDSYEYDKVIGDNYIDFCIKALGFNPSRYRCTLTFAENEVSNILDWHDKCYEFIVTGGSVNYGVINPFPEWLLST